MKEARAAESEASAMQKMIEAKIAEASRESLAKKEATVEASAEEKAAAVNAAIKEKVAIAKEESDAAKTADNIKSAAEEEESLKRGKRTLAKNEAIVKAVETETAKEHHDDEEKRRFSRL
jgi:hypothetical protein